MTIEIKYPVKSAVWYMLNDKPQFGKIINWSISGLSPKVLYYANPSFGASTGRYESEFFLTKEALIASL